MMKRRFSLLGVVVLAAVWLLPASLRAAHFVFTNNDVSGANSVTTFSVDPSTFALTNLGTTPTGGTTCGGDLYLRSIIASPDGNYLYVANGASANITTFRINKTTGGLTAVGTPVATGNYVGCAKGGTSAALAINQQATYLYAANRGVDTISIFSVARNGTLTPVGSPMTLPGTPFSIQVRPPDKFLAVGLLVPPSSNSAVAMFSIGSRGELRAVPGSPFAVEAEDIQWDFNCGCKLLFSTQLDVFGGGTTVDVLGVSKNGALSPVRGSPFYFDQGTNTSAGVLWNPFGQMLFVSSGGSNSIEDFIVGPRGDLKSGANQPVNLGSPAAPIGMAVNIIETHTHMIRTLLYAADFSSSSVHVLTVDEDGTLTPVPGSPFPTGQGEYSGLGQLAVVPGGGCRESGTGIFPNYSQAD
jgi:6-phosphogluconolactonase (cycloisomerase 2 family)